MIAIVNVQILVLRVITTVFTTFTWLFKEYQISFSRITKYLVYFTYITELHLE